MGYCKFSIQSELSPAELISKFKLNLKDHVGSFTEIDGGGELSINVFDIVIKGIVVIKNNLVEVHIQSNENAFSCQEIQHYLESISMS